MAEITFKGNRMRTAGALPAVGSRLPGFTLTGKDLADVTLADFAGKRLVFNIFPSLDTEVCAVSVRRFNAEAGGLEGTAVLCVSADLPFAQGRFCAAEGLANVVALSSFRSPEFGEAFGVTFAEGPLRGLLSRAVVVADAAGRVVYTEQVAEVTHEPDYAAALAALGNP